MSRRIVALRIVIVAGVAILAGYLWQEFFSVCRRCLPPTSYVMYAVQLAVEDFGVEHDGRYPNTSLELDPYVCGRKLRNSFTNAPLLVIVRNGAHGETTHYGPGTVVVARPDSQSYEIRGCSKHGQWIKRSNGDPLRLRSEPSAS